MGLAENIQIGGLSCKAYEKRKQIQFYNQSGLLESIGKNVIDALIHHIADNVYAILSYYRGKTESQYRMARHFKTVLSYAFERVDIQPTLFAFASSFQVAMTFSACSDSEEAWDRIKRIILHFQETTLDTPSIDEALCRSFISEMTKECVTELANSFLNDLNLTEGSEREELFKNSYVNFLDRLSRLETRSREREEEKAAQRVALVTQTVAAELAISSEDQETPAVDTTNADQPASKAPRLI